MSSLFFTVLTQPLFNGLVFLYNTVAFSDLGVAIILLTILVRTLLYPFFYKGLKNQALMQKIQPQIEAVQKEHKENKEEQAKQMMALWKEHKINPFSGFLLLIIQLPILLAIYRVFLTGLNKESLSGLYSFVHTPEILNNSLLGLIDLSERSVIIVILAVAAAYIQGKMALSKSRANSNSKSAKMAKKMSLLAPGIILIFLINFSSAIGLYILVTTLFSILQQYLINKRIYGGETEGKN